MRIDVTLTARLLNADKCREGEVAETDVVFPTTKAAIQEALKAVGVDGIRCRNVFLIEHDSNLSGFCHCLNQSDSVDELNYLCHLLSDMTDTELATFRAVVEYGAHNENAAALINLALNVESYDFYAGVDSDKELGRIYVEDMGTIDVPEEVRPFFDYAAYGRKVREDDKGCFVNDGYLMRSVLCKRRLPDALRPDLPGTLSQPGGHSQGIPGICLSQTQYPGTAGSLPGNERQDRPAQQARPRGGAG